MNLRRVKTVGLASTVSDHISVTVLLGSMDQIALNVSDLLVPFTEVYRTFKINKFCFL